MIIHLTEGLGDDQGAFTGKWFDTETATPLNPSANRGASFILWRTSSGAFVLTLGSPARPLSIRAELITVDRAAAVYRSWGKVLPPQYQALYAANEV